MIRRTNCRSLPTPQGPFFLLWSPQWWQSSRFRYLLFTSYCLAWKSGSVSVLHIMARPGWARTNQRSSQWYASITAIQTQVYTVASPALYHKAIPLSRYHLAPCYSGGFFCLPQVHRRLGSVNTKFYTTQSFFSRKGTWISNNHGVCFTTADTNLYQLHYAS